jgi:hypothetical protein
VFADPLELVEAESLPTTLHAPRSGKTPNLSTPMPMKNRSLEHGPTKGARLGTGRMRSARAGVLNTLTPGHPGKSGGRPEGIR